MQDKPSLTSQSSPLPKESTYLHHRRRHYVPRNNSSKLDGPSFASSKCFLLSIPDESLTHITSFVADPPSLFALSRVNRRLRDHIADDNTWYRAFASHFLGVGPENEPEDDKNLMVRRSESTWMKEYVVRFNLIRRWERSRTTTLNYQPHYWDVSNIHLLENMSLMTANLQYGIVTRSFPLTGKILKGYLDASGTRNGLGIGNPNEEFSPNVTSIALSSSGGTGRVAWGFRNGEVAITSAPRIMESTCSVARYARCRVEDEHPGEVHCIAFSGRDDDLLVTGCTHGVVKIWDPKRMLCLWTGSAKKVDAVPATGCVVVEFNLGTGVLVTSLTDGDIMVWWGLQSLCDDGLMVNAARELRIPKEVSSESCTINSLSLDPNSSSSRAVILVHYADAQRFLRLIVHLPTGVVHRTLFGDGPLGPITAIKACFAAAQECSFVLTGDSLGRVCVWNWGAGQNGASAQTQVGASRKWEAHDYSAICAIEVCGAVIVTGCAHGIIRVWDSLTLNLLRSFSSPSKTLTPGGVPVSVGKIFVRGDLLVANIGNRILVWQAAAVTDNKKGKRRFSKKSNDRGTRTINKWQQQIELNWDIRESQCLLAHERVRTQGMHGREQAQLETLERLGLDEKGAVEYLLMLSREEEELRRTSSATPPSSTEKGSSEGIVSFSTDDDAEGVFTLDVFPATFSTSSSPRSMPRSPPASNSKVQVSSPFLLELTKAGRLSTNSRRIVADTARVPMDERRCSLPNPADFPEISASTSSTPSRSVQLGGSWLRGSPASSSVSTNTSSTPASSSSLSPKNRAGIVMSRAEQEDEELKFVLELSLAEARSRGQV